MTTTSIQRDRLREAIETRSSTSVKVGPHRIKLYADRDRSRFILCWYSGLKRERWETTDRAAALSMASKIVDHYEHGSSIAQKISPDRIQSLIEADSALHGVNLEELVKHFKAHLQTQKTPLSEVCRLFQKSLEDGGASPRHRDTVKLHLIKLGKSFRCSIGAIQTESLDAFLSSIPNLKTRKNHRITIVSLFRFAQRKGFLPQGETAADRTETPRTEPKEPSTISAGTLSLLLDLCRDEKLKTFLLVGAFAGCRSSEIQRLKWSDVREDYIILGPSITKTRRRRIAEVPPNLRLWLSSLRKKPDDFLTYPEELAYTLYRRVRSLSKRAKVAWEHNALRHTFVSCHLELHRDPPRTSKTSGHSLAVLESSYLKLTPKEEAQRWFDIVPTNSLTPEPLCNHNHNHNHNHAEPTKSC